jgi:hypothetical protein
MELEGTLETFPLKEIIDMMLYSSVTGALELSVGGAKGYMFCRDGRLYHVTYATLVGKEALLTLFERDDARFRFLAGMTTTEESLWVDPWDLIAQGERHAAVWQRIRPYVQDVESIPRLIRDVPPASLALSDTALTSVRLVDGQRSIRAIAEQLGQVTVEVAEAMAELVQAGFIQVRAMPVGLPTTNGTAHKSASSSTLSSWLQSRRMNRAS